MARRNWKLISRSTRVHPFRPSPRRVAPVAVVSCVTHEKLAELCNRRRWIGRWGDSNWKRERTDAYNWNRRASRYLCRCGDRQYLRACNSTLSCFGVPPKIRRKGCLERYQPVIITVTQARQAGRRLVSRRRRGWSLNCTAAMFSSRSSLSDVASSLSSLAPFSFPNRSVFRSLCASERSFQVTLDRLSISHGERGRTSKRYNAPPPSFSL